jgi:hypothetical protein
MAVQGHHATLAKDQSGQHALFARDKLAVEQRIQVLGGHLRKANVLDVRRLLISRYAHSADPSFREG